ncbi:MAG: histidinol-phosphate transaminase [Acidobacteria bacterium]|nr:histidinol-phosphate transaminase [Acidobacteriota bacterium]
MATAPQLSRRTFAQLLGMGAGAALLAPVQGRGGEERLAAWARGEWRPAKLLPKESANLVLLNSNENPYGPSPAALEAMVEAHSVSMRYPDYWADQLQERLAAFHGVDPEMAVVTCGSTEVLKLAAMAFLAPGRRLVVPRPTFEAMGYYARLAGAEVVEVPVGPDYRSDLAALARTARERPGLVYLCNPNNPTGTLVSAAAVREFLTGVPAESVVLVDEAYYHYPDDPGYGTLLEAVRAGRNVVVARTFSKIYGMAGLRLGYGIARKDWIEKMRPHQVIESWNVMACAAALASLEDTDYVNRNRRLNQEVRDALAAAMKKRGREVIPSQTNFVCIHVGAPVRPVIQAFREQGVSVGRPFAGLEEHIRVSLGTPEEMEKFLAGFDRVMASAAARRI